MSGVKTLSSSGFESSGADSSLSISKSKNSNVSTFTEVQKTAIDTNGDVFKVPDFTIKQILGAIPKHCYQRSLVRSLGYVVRDISCMCIIGYVGQTYIPLVEQKWARFILWNVYSYVLGLFGFGLWILAHECGHGAFSDYQNVNDFIGWVLHSWWVVPYFSWKFSHSKHHKATGHQERDEVFLPWKKDEWLSANNVKNVAELTEETPIYALLKIIFQQIGGLQTYLLTNATGQAHEGWSKLGKSHYNPSSPVFDAKDYWYIVLSDIGILTTFTIVYLWYKTFGLFSVTINWFVPWCYVNHWLVFVTFLQHTDLTLPHYEASEWTFAKGAAATIDRNFGFVGQHIFHDIIETHVLHHYVSRIPFYNAREATEAIKQVMGEHYRYSGENMWISLWKTFRACQFVEGDNGVLMFRNANGYGVGTGANLKK